MSLYARAMTATLQQLNVIFRIMSSSVHQVFSLEEELQLAHKQIDDLQERSRKEIVSINEQKSTLVRFLFNHSAHSIKTAIT